MKLATAIVLYANAGYGSSLIDLPGDPNETLEAKDRVRRRLVKTNPDVDAALSPDSQTDNAGFVGKKYRVQDVSYGQYVSEHDSTESANHAANARPYSRVLKHPQWDQEQSVRDIVRKKAAKEHRV